jgi:hypothetical protein
MLAVVYGVLVPKKLVSWWIVKLHMRLQGDLKAMVAAIDTFWPPFPISKVALSTTNRKFMTIWSNLYLEILMALDIQCGSRKKC